MSFTAIRGDFNCELALLVLFPGRIAPRGRMLSELDIVRNGGIPCLSVRSILPTSKSILFPDSVIASLYMVMLPLSVRVMEHQYNLPTGTPELNRAAT